MSSLIFIFSPSSSLVSLPSQLLQVPFEVACTNQMCKPNTRVLLEIHKRNEAAIEMLSGSQIRNWYGRDLGSDRNCAKISHIQMVQHHLLK